MQDLPWWALSPSPFSIAFYLVLIFFAAGRLRRLTDYGRFSRLKTLSDAFFLLGFFVLIGDLTWVVACGFRFGLEFFDSLPQLLMAGGRDIAGILLCSYWLRQAQRNCLVNINQHTMRLLLLNAVFIAVWFLLAPNPAWTDWTFAFRHNFSGGVVISSFFISHVLGKFLIGCAFLSIWF